MNTNKHHLCYLCGQTIEPKLRNDPMALSMDHVPPRQFYPKQIRRTENLNLNIAPSHKRCNEAYKNDEEYFYHSLYPIIAKNNPQLGNLVAQDIQRRSLKQQTPAIIQRILSTKSTVTKGGIHLPNGLSQFALDGKRIERVAAKIARGILFLSTERYFEEQQIIRIDFYDDLNNFLKTYKPALQLNPLAGVYSRAFAHSHFSYKDFRLLLMFFWGAFIFQVIAKDTK
ncbi:MAG: hypothetical protein CVV39_03225 [Planctomycetes bacterium HGW-Planctomycetes-1]|nr:MAG: hypothetical protein CVV39_03225 [Planctomycetes bacterium HGW-Planctomycetes-1]